jgi:hypothetical protein
MTTKIFISYKTSDSHVARVVADWLIYNHIDVWFAEYSILLDGRKTQDVAQSLKIGIASCSHAILFTNERYADSEWCRDHELKVIVRDLPYRKILIVGLSEHPQSLETIHRIDIPIEILQISLPERTQVNLTQLEDAMRRLGWPIPATMKGFEKLPVVPAVPTRLPFLDIWLNLHDWVPVDSQERSTAGFKSQDAYFLRDINGPLQLCVTSAWYSDISRMGPLPADIPPGMFDYEAKPLEQLALPSRDNDEALYNYAIALAKEYSDRLVAASGRSVTVTGVHLVFFAEQSHFAMSYDLVDPEMGTLAARKYVIVLRDAQDCEGVYEFVFTFNTYGSRERLCSLSPYLDYVVTCAVPLTGRPVEFSGRNTALQPSKRWSDTTHPLLRHLLNSPMFKAARPTVLAGTPPARVGNSQHPKSQGGSVIFAMSLVIAIVLVLGVTVAFFGLLSRVDGLLNLKSHDVESNVAEGQNTTWTRIIAIACFSGAATAVALNQMLRRFAVDNNAIQTRTFLSMAAVGAMVQGMICSMISMVGERVPVPFLIAFSLGVLGSILASAFGIQCLILRLLQFRGRRRRPQEQQLRV